MNRTLNFSVVALLSAAAATAASGQGIAATDTNKAILAIQSAEANICQYMARDLGVGEQAFVLECELTPNGRNFTLRSSTMPLGAAGEGQFYATGRLSGGTTFIMTLRCDTSIGSFIGSGTMTYEVLDGMIIGGRGDHLIASGPVGGGGSPPGGPPNPPPPPPTGGFNDFHEYWGLVIDPDFPNNIPGRRKCWEHTVNTLVISQGCEPLAPAVPIPQDLGFSLPTFSASGVVFAATGSGVLDPDSESGTVSIVLSASPACPWSNGIMSDWCPADFNGDGASDSDDILSFFGAWDQGESCADVDASGSTDSDDIVRFFTAWDNGGC